MEQETAMNKQDWALKLFSKSPLKQRKLEKLLSFSDSYEGKTCLDIGSDNGVISLLLRKNGGIWYSADLIPETVSSIKELVGERVDQIDGISMPYNDAQFDSVLIVDFLEHIETDREFIKELYRILNKNGTLIVNVPNPKEGLLRKIKHWLGQTDEAHGHVRPGYDLNAIKDLLGDKFKIERNESYSRVFSDLVDTAITFALDLLKGKRGKKGTVVTSADLNKLKKSFKLFSLIYPVFWLVVKFDKFFPFLHGNMLIVRARKV